MNRLVEPITKSLSSDDPKNGSIIFTGQNPSGKDLTGIFSMVFYLPDETVGFSVNDKTTMKYFIGINAYVQMIHHEDSMLKTFGLVIYTNAYTLKKLQEAFPLETYPNLIFAEVNWAYYSDEHNEVNKNIMRTLRFHAVEHFQNQDIHVRDADTLFTALMGYGGKPINELNKQIEEWETNYAIDFIEAIRPEKQIVLGTYDAYQQYYHRNFPYSFPFTFLLLQSGKSSIYQTPSLEVRNKGSVKDLYAYYVKKYGFYPDQGIYAGFVSILKNRSGIENFWDLCLKYLFDRFKIIEYKGIPNLFLLKGQDPSNNPVKSKKITANELILPKVAVGKDEKILLYSIIPNYIDKILFYNVEYAVGGTAEEEFLNPKSVKKYKNENYLHYQKDYLRVFKSMSDEYREWLEDFYIQYPTEDAFIEAVEANIMSKLEPASKEQIKEKGLLYRTKNGGSRKKIKRSRKTRKTKSH